MRKTMKKLLGILLMLLLGYAAGAQNHPDKIETLINAYYQADCFSGVVLVSEKGKVIYRKAYGLADREWNIPMTPETKFRIASLSKPFTALLILQLVEEGLIRLDGKIIDYLPDYQGKNGDRITIEQLLTHTSGILQSLDPEQEAIQERLAHSLREMVRYAEEADVYFEPGTGFHYSNLAYSILALIAERVAQIPFDRLLEERIFRPLEMKNTTQCQANRIERNLAKGYEYTLLGGYENASPVDPSYTVGPGGLIADMDDLCRFDKALRDRRLISEELYDKMFQPTKYGPYGYGWELCHKIPSGRQDTLSIISHTGSINGFGAFIARIEKDSVLVVVLKNHRSDTYISPAFAPAIGWEIISLLYDEDVKLPVPSIARYIGFMIGQQGIDAAIEAYHERRSSDPDGYNFEESELNQLGIELLFRYNLTEEALKIFELNMHEFPYSYNTYDSYAYTLRQKGDYSNAIKYYKMGLEILEKYPEQNNHGSVKKDAENALRSIHEMEIENKS